MWVCLKRKWVMVLGVCPGGGISLVEGMKILVMMDLDKFCVLRIDCEER
jgi:hypothetical protein